MACNETDDEISGDGPANSSPQVMMVAKGFKPEYLSAHVETAVLYLLSEESHA